MYLPKVDEINPKLSNESSKPSELMDPKSEVFVSVSLDSPTKDSNISTSSSSHLPTKKRSDSRSSSPSKC